MPPTARNTRLATLGVVACLGAASALAQTPSARFDRGHGLQTWQHHGYAQLVSHCKTPPAAFGIPVSHNIEPPALEFPPPTTAIPGVMLSGAADASNSGTVAASGQNVHVDSGSQMTLAVAARQ